MKKRIIIIIAVIILVVIVSFVIVFYFSNIDRSNFSNSNVLTASQKCGAVYIGLTGSYMGGIVLDNPGNFNIGPVSPLSGGYNGVTGYINTTDKLVQVPVILSNGAAWFAQYYLVYVDLTRHTVMGTEWADAHHFPATFQVNIPPGAGWYQELEVNGMTNNFQISYGNGSPIAMPVILDGDNLQKAISGESYQAINASLNMTPGQNTVDVLINGSGNLYILIKNERENMTAADIFIR